VVKKIHYNTREGRLVVIRKKTRGSLPAIQHAGFLDGVFARRQLTCMGMAKKKLSMLSFLRI